MMLRRPSPGLVLAGIALFVALGGGAYAAVTLPRNSVGTKQLKNGAVTLKKINKRARVALRGQQGAPGPLGAAGAQGPQGPQGPAGPPGTPAPAGALAPKYFAHIGYDAGNPIIRSSNDAGISVAKPNNVLTVTFPTDVGSCVTQLTLNDSGINGTIRKGYSVSGGKQVVVVTQDTAGNVQNYEFDIVEIC